VSARDVSVPERLPKLPDKTPVSSPQAPQAIGPYSPAVRAGQWLFISGQVAIDPSTGNFSGGDIRAETHQVMRNIGALLAAAGLHYASIVRTTVYLSDLSEFAAMNEVYGAYFSQPYPARATVQVARLPRDARVEIDAIASY
jgi:2-iminobutanoate/2-iminopropanoate deaminase